MKKIFCALTLIMMSLPSIAETSIMTHRDGSKTKIITDESNTTIETYAKGALKPSGRETNSLSHKSNVDRVAREGKDKANPVVPPIIKE